jgi:hypothetical protein
MKFARTEIARRQLIALAAALTALGTLPASTAAGPLKLVLVHGRGQQGLDPAELKTTWMDTLRSGAEANGKSLP